MLRRGNTFSLSAVVRLDAANCKTYKLEASKPSMFHRIYPNKVGRGEGSSAPGNIAG
jgi:hypothetical protein